MKKSGHLIKAVLAGSIAEELELAPGDRLLSINGREVEDIFDYEYEIENESLIAEIEKSDGEIWELEIENGGEDLGLVFENGLMSDYRTCSNKCIFCFVDQMPPGMRPTLYFKDDDTRLSFLQGNYVTLTNLKERDIRRIIEFRLAPINISIHTTNPKLRCQMLHNRFAGRSLAYIDMLYQAGVPMNGQIVLCRGVNDGAELDRTIRDLEKYAPVMESVSVVPVGLSKFRRGLHPLTPFDAGSCGAAIDLIESWQKRIYAEKGLHFIHASDEFYAQANRPLPEEERYDGYPQLENGVGMLRLLNTEVDEALAACDSGFPEGVCRARAAEPETLSLATGRLAYPYIKEQLAKIQKRFPWKEVRLFSIRNDFFGESITVSGLITGADLIAQLAGQKLGSRLLLPSSMFRIGEEVFLDDVTRAQAQSALQVPVDIVKSGGQDLVEAVLCSPPSGKKKPVPAGPQSLRAEYQGYELRDCGSDSSKGE